MSVLLWFCILRFWNATMKSTVVILCLIYLRAGSYNDHLSLPPSTQTLTHPPLFPLPNNFFRFRWIKVLPSAAAENVGDLRFAGKGARSSAGRLEIFLGAGYEWGTVSHRAFDQRSADVACRQLGYEGAKSFGLAMNR